MAVTSVSSTGAQSALSKSSLGIQDFLKTLTTQLSYQDPLKPMDNQEFIAQLAQFTSLQQTQQMNEKLDSLLSIQAATQSVGLIGRSVDVRASDGTTVSGQVSALNFARGEPQLTVTLTNGSTLSDVSLSNLITVR